MAGTVVANTINTDTGLFSTNNAYSGIAKAWVQFTGSSATINGSFNVSSITRNGTGDYTANFTTAMPDTNYVPLITTSGDQDGSLGSGSWTPNLYRNGGSLTAPTTTGFYFLCNWNGSGSGDPTYISIAVFR